MPGIESVAKPFNSLVHLVADQVRDDASRVVSTGQKLVDDVYARTKPVSAAIENKAGQAAQALVKFEERTGIAYYIPPLGLQERAVNMLDSVLPKSQYKRAEPGYNLQFPRDDAAHKDYKTEWWYYVGHLQGDDGHRYGYELTFFRHKLFSQDLYSAHLALTDVDKQSFQFKERSSVTQPTIAGSNDKNYYVWNGTWKAGAAGGGKQSLEAGTPEFSIKLQLDAQGRPILHGDNGLSAKGPEPGQASYYYSRPNLPTDGTISRNGKSIHVTGTSWMDHEFGSDMMKRDIQGWNWYAVQLENNSQLMLYMLRKPDGTMDPSSSATIINTNGSTRHIKSDEMKIESTGSWTSPDTRATYPMGWQISIPSEKIDLSINPLVKNQEMRTQRSVGLAYWEGACDVNARVNGKDLKGNAYVELTGYQRPFSSLPDQLKP